MATPRKRTTSKPGTGSVEDLRSRAAALREEANRLVAAAERRARTSPVDGDSEPLWGNGKVHHDVNGKLTSPESGINAARAEHLRLDRDMGRHETFGDASPIMGDFVAPLSRPTCNATGLLDPVFGLIEAHRAAYSAWEPVAALWNEADIGSREFASARAAAEQFGRLEQEAFLALLTTRPTTAAGLWALTAYLPEVMRKVSPDPETQAQAALDALREGAVQLGLARAVTAADPSPDAVLIQACDGAVRIFDMLNGPLSSLPEDAFNACMAQTEKLIEIAIVTPATTREGLVGKARVLKNEWPCNDRHGKLDNGDLLICSLVWDLAGKEARP
ncbi:hypothetical protein [Methylobacterium nonmethylotrophicum]|uniref:Uncharacterized protein n=1 Tax=Methylobacterium nonmethylotrophicum TaxID=1141884 RepID=A0A4Z0NFS2_9HYPH|nr:hypothetical protein [Methylobacterium nonmethylotrophicum]TGD94918.1 hypothetical protein EU555_30570 [Methylobacterium nonmethylotrophicum]